MVSAKIGQPVYMFVLTVSNLVDRFLLWAGQLSVPIECLFFEKKSDFVTGGQEVVVSYVIIVPGSELGLQKQSNE